MVSLSVAISCGLIVAGNCSHLGIASECIAYNFPIVDKSSGKELTIDLLLVEPESLTVRDKAGKVFKLPTSKLSIETLESARRASEKLGKLLYPIVEKKVGHSLFGDVSLWEQQAASVAKRLKWEAEEKGSVSSSYRLYPDENYRFLNVRPYCATLYSKGWQDTTTPSPVSKISLVFANKGDFASTAGMGLDHFDDDRKEEDILKPLKMAMNFDYNLLQKNLTEAIGVEPIKQYYGEKSDKRLVLRWDLLGHSFLLSKKKLEYVSLLIVSTSEADALGKAARVNDSDLKKILIKNVVKNKNGDVYLTKLPMVNQGPKGYCAPATMERAMRYMGIPADMYLLATVATKAGSGTNTAKLLE